MAEEPREEPWHQRYLVVSAHPDDPEFGFGGTVAKLVREGADVYYVICSDGSQGGEDPSVPDLELVAVREREQRAAAEMLGVRDVFYLGRHDGYLTPDWELRRDITRQIRLHRPDVVLTHRPDRVIPFPIGMSHPDHLAVGEATFAAVYPDARNPRAYRELLAEGLQPHKVREIWVGAVGSGLEPDHVVDITQFIDMKLDAIRCHRSQFAKPGQEPTDVEKWIRDRSRSIGEANGFEYAEAFRRVPTG
jgi:LmbE family N-acetylglucosaminyl deacetylase